MVPGCGASATSNVATSGHSSHGILGRIVVAKEQIVQGLAALLVAGAATAFAASSTQAADLYVPEPEQVLTVDAVDWTGFYLGGHVGYGWVPSRSRTPTTSSKVTSTTSTSTTSPDGSRAYRPAITTKAAIWCSALKPTSPWPASPAIAAMPTTTPLAQTSTGSALSAAAPVLPPTSCSSTERSALRLRRHQLADRRLAIRLLRNQRCQIWVGRRFRRRDDGF